MQNTGAALTEYEYDDGGHLTGLTNKINNIVAEAYSYQYDLAGNRTSEAKQ